MNQKNILKQNQIGMSLVELMIAMVISLFLSLGIFTMFSMSSSNVTTTSQFNQLQENGRIALAILERDISQLGFMGDLTGTDFILDVNTTIEGLAAITDCEGGGLNNATLPNNQPSHFRRLWGYEHTSSATETLTCLGSANVKIDTDVIQIKRFVGPDINIPLAAAEQGDIYVSANASEAVFYKGAAPAKTLTNAREWQYQHHVYYVADDADSIPLLRRVTLTENGMTNQEQLVEGIENIRFLYGFDDDGDSTPDSYLAESAVLSNMWDNESFQRLVAVKIFILVRSIQADRSYTNETTYQLGDKEIAAPNDNFRRKVMSTTVVLENPVLIRN
ncbi:PilW family protein [Shewanella sp. UCD-KL21]|uniref:PilW family protein n=1 Tax=Shewanella sp. UCD-KL21 TaxID=1917164 RepID=UPI0009704262|nr:PilW family protein [Shewanella sp. UCD-KL21]